MPPRRFSLTHRSCWLQHTFNTFSKGYDHAPALVTSACEQLRRSVPSLNVQTTVDEGVPKDAIVDAARRWNADLIVVGSHGYGRIRSILLGSVAMGVLSEAPCSVLVARVKQDTEDGELGTPVTACH